MEDLDRILDEITAHISKTEMDQLPPDLDSDLAVHLISGFLKSVGIEDVATEFVNSIGEKSIQSFYEGTTPPETTGVDLAIGRFLFLVSKHCTIERGRSVALNRDGLKEQLSAWMQDIKNGSGQITLRLRLAGIRIPRSFTLGDVEVHEISSETVRTRYSYDKWAFRTQWLPEFAWVQHVVEAVKTTTGTPLDFQRLLLPEQTSELVNKVTSPFLLCHVGDSVLPLVTDILASSSFDGRRHMRDVGFIDPTPLLLRDEEIDSLVSASDCLVKAQKDEVLNRACDRFLIAKKRPFQDPHRVNEPNWDKLVDLVIGMETLFLGAPKESHQDLKYRFRLNGSTLMSEFLPNTRQELFNALGVLYDLRSSVVHGNRRSRIIEVVKKFLRSLSLEDNRVTHDLGHFRIVVDQLTSWARMLVYHMVEKEADSRPYATKGGWERFLWSSEPRPWEYQEGNE